MHARTTEEEIKELMERWNRSIIDKDVATAAELREADYTATWPDGQRLTREQELATIASPGHTIESISLRNLEVRELGDEASAVADNLIVGEYMGGRLNDVFKFSISFRKTGGRWRARSSHLTATEVLPGTAPPQSTARPTRASGLGRLVPGAVRSWARKKFAAPAPTFPELAYHPYKPGRDFAIPAPVGDGVGTEAAELPLPPTDLWLGYNYPAHGQLHVSKMLEVVDASDFSFRPGDRVLDFGCGAGRMIRHLHELSRTCEIWGADLSAEHVYWCKQHLSPPFHFVTTTKVPHLPFEDASFRFIYCGSVFTHIDDLTDAWLLELRRILAPGGRLYLTIHDQHTVELLESGRHDHAEVVRWIKSREAYQQHKGSFGMLVVGRDSAAQVFYDTTYFKKTLSPMFEILSITPEAYFYQTAFLLTRKPVEG